MKTIFIGTNNQGKLREFAHAFSQLNIDISSPEKLELKLDIPETGSTFAENALSKAKAWAKASKLPTLVDDSGLCVDALDGRPGIYSARFVSGSDNDRNNEILTLLKNVPKTKRSAYYVCAIAFFDPTAQTEHVSEGFCHGHILRKAQGDNGFGYDPIFMPKGYNLSFGQLSNEIKSKISHRANALTLMLDYLKNWTKI